MTDVGDNNGVIKLIIVTQAIITFYLFIIYNLIMTGWILTCSNILYYRVIDSQLSAHIYKKIYKVIFSI